jgi:hypothetical protein
MHALLMSAKMAIEKGISQDHNAVERMFAFMLPKFLDGVHKVIQASYFFFLIFIHVICLPDLLLHT